MVGMTEREQLLFCIAYALKLKARMPVRSRASPPLEVKDFVGVAKVVVEHLEECGYEIAHNRDGFSGPGLHSKL